MRGHRMVLERRRGRTAATALVVQMMLILSIVSGIDTAQSTDTTVIPDEDEEVVVPGPPGEPFDEFPVHGSGGYDAGLNASWWVDDPNDDTLWSTVFYREHSGLDFEVVPGCRDIETNLTKVLTSESHRVQTGGTGGSSEHVYEGLVSCILPPLNRTREYDWYVIVSESAPHMPARVETEGPKWKFGTLAEEPDLPLNPEPGLGETIQSGPIDLSWEDPSDNVGLLTYRVLGGTDPTGMAAICNNLSVPTCRLSTEAFAD